MTPKQLISAAAQRAVDSIRLDTGPERYGRRQSHIEREFDWIEGLIESVENLIYAHDHECDKGTIVYKAQIALRRAQGERIENNQH